MAVRTDSVWTWEIAATTCSAIFLSLITILLIVYDEKPIFRWHGITLNAIISLLSTSNKAALLFTIAECIGQWKWILFSRTSRSLMDLERVDCASRGPLGSMVLLWPFRNMSVLRLGALLTILAIALDPFAQQLIQTKQVFAYTVDPGARISCARRYSKGTRTQLDLWRIGQAATFAQTDYTMEYAILYGLATPYRQVVQQTPVYCPSGNCRWSSFDSLAVCSTCNDLASYLEFSDGGSNFLPDFLNRRTETAASCQPGSTFALPNNLMLNNRNGISLHNGSQVVLASAYGTSNASETLTLRDRKNLIWSMTILRIPPSTGTSNLWPTTPIEAVECGLEYCVRGYQSKVENGVLNEIETDLHIERDSNSWQTRDWNYTESAKYLNWTRSTYDNLQFDNVTSSLRRTDLSFGEQFNVSQTGVDSISVHFQNEFPPLNLPKDYCGDESAPELVLNGWCMEDDYSPSVMQIFNRSTSINDTFTSLARSMSNALRASDDDNSMVIGETGNLMTHYHIVWPWIALHAAILVGGIIFLGATIHESQTLGIPAWKSSSLAQLSIHTEIGDILAGVESVPLMEVKARQHFVQLFKN